MMKTGFEKAKRTCWQHERLLLAALLLHCAIAVGQIQATTRLQPAPIRPFKMHVPDRVLIDLRRRLAEAKWPDQLPGTTWEYGADIKKVRELVDYWQNGYDWRAQEAKIISSTSSQRKLMDSRFILSISSLLAPTLYR